MPTKVIKPEVIIKFMELGYLTSHFPLFVEWHYKSSEFNQNFSLMRHNKIFPEFLAGNSREVSLINFNTSFKSGYSAV